MPAAARAFDDAVGLVGELVDGSFRRDCVAELARAGSGREALLSLGASMRAHRWRAGGKRIDLSPAVRALDRRTRGDGLHALHDWDGVAGAVNREMIPVDVVNLAIESRGGSPAEPAALAILLDYYCLYLLALLSLRVWDEGAADESLDRLAGLVGRLQGPHGSGQRFARDAETLLLIATSHYEADERAYAMLLDRVRALDARHQTAIALGHASSMGCHLRFGFEATYARSLQAMRDDNAADYPWLSYALVTLMREYARLAAAGVPPDLRRPVALALLNGLSPDPDAFVGNPSVRVPVPDADRLEFRDGFERHRQDLLEAFASCRPSDAIYSPLAFFFNFCQNVLKGAVLDAVLWGEPSPVSVNDLITAPPDGDADDASRLAVARTLMGYARANPHSIRGRPMPVIVYDVPGGRRAHAAVIAAAGAR